MNSVCRVYELGLVEYGEAYHLQRRLLEERAQGGIGDTLLLLEHPPVITLGTSGKLENILVSQQELSRRGISIFFTDRGGDVTYHGPGQLVGYPIIDLRGSRDIRRYLYSLEEVLIRTLSHFYIKAGRDEAHPGVWVEGKEIASIGLKVKNWVTMHGFALNVDVDLEPFSLINPCGFADRGVTSISAFTSREVTVAEVAQMLLSTFAEVFGFKLNLGYHHILARPQRCLSL